MSKSNVLFVDRVPLAAFLRLVGPSYARAIMITVMRGILNALAEHKMSPIEAENLLFNPDILSLAQEYALDPEIIEAIEYGMELSDIEELLDDPRALDNAIAECATLLENLRITTMDTPYLSTPSLLTVRDR
ncbi:MAG: DUF3969 family protein [Anaerolineae bacterium]